MGCVATVAAFGLHRNVFVDEWSLLIGVTFNTGRISGRHGSDLTQRGRTVDVVAVAALDKAFVDSMVIRLCEVGLGRGVTPITEIGLRPHKQVFRILRMVR